MSLVATSRLGSAAAGAWRPAAPRRAPSAGMARGARASAAGLLPALLALLALLAAAAGANAQGAAEAGAEEMLVEGRQAGDVFGVGRTVRVRGEVLHGVMAFGGDLVIEGRVAGDAAAIGGSVIQLEGSHVGGDVMVFGGVYRAEQGAGRAAAGKTFMFAGYGDELREMTRNPASLLTPRLTAAFVGWRVMAVLFWFVVSLALTAAAPGVVSSAAARLQLTSWRVALIGLLGAVVVGPGGAAALRYLPPMVGGLFFVTGLLLLIVSYLFGRVVVHAVTGRWLQRVLLPEARRSETVALLLGAAFWAVALALPFVWPLLVAGLVVLSLGLALTARYGLAWKRA